MGSQGSINNNTGENLSRKQCVYGYPSYCSTITHLIHCKKHSDLNYSHDFLLGFSKQFLPPNFPEYLLNTKHYQEKKTAINRQSLKKKILEQLL